MAQEQHSLQLPTVIAANGTTIDIVAASDTMPVIAIRFLGSMCSHCMQQLLLFKEYSEEFKKLGVRVIAFSDNEVSACQRVTSEYQFSPEVFSICSDSSNVCSRALGTTITERNGNVTELHGLLVLQDRTVLFEHYSALPYKDVRKIMSVLQASR